MRSTDTGERGSKPGDGANQVVPDPFTGGVMTVDEWATQVALPSSLSGRSALHWCLQH